MSWELSDSTSTNGFRGEHRSPSFEFLSAVGRLVMVGCDPTVSELDVLR